MVGDCTGGGSGPRAASTLTVGEGTDATAGRPVRLAFIALTPPHPIGGVAMIFEYASAMARRGHDVHLFHVGGFGPPAERAEDIGWFRFTAPITHHFPPQSPVNLDALRRADIVFGFGSGDETPPHDGLPVVLIQGWRMLPPADERAAFLAPCPKVCVASWLVGVGRHLGVPAEQLVHVPLGLNHDKYRLLRPIERRRPRVSFCFNVHRQKRADLAVEVLELVRSEVADLDAVAFGSVPPDTAVPPWLHVRVDPPQRELVGDIYNGSAVFLCTSDVEGFGLPCIEAMACGAALVTTDNGGSRDYALDGRTALVAPTGDAEALAGHVVWLLRDEEERVRLASAGERWVRRFDWDRSGALLEDLLVRYLADPAGFGYVGSGPACAER